MRIPSSDCRGFRMSRCNRSAGWFAPRRRDTAFGGKRTRALRNSLTSGCASGLVQRRSAKRSDRFPLGSFGKPEVDAICTGTSACGMSKGRVRYPAFEVRAGSAVAGPGILHSRHDDGSADEFYLALSDHSKESRIHGGRRLISQPKDDDARSRAARDRENVSEIQIKGKHNSALHHSFRGDLRSREAE